MDGQSEAVWSLPAFRPNTLWVWSPDNMSAEIIMYIPGLPAGVEELAGAPPAVRWLGMVRTAHCMERGAWAALLAWAEPVVLSSGSSSRYVSWSASSLWLLLLSESLESFDWESSSEKKAGTLLAP